MNIEQSQKVLTWGWDLRVKFSQPCFEIRINALHSVKRITINVLEWLYETRKRWTRILKNVDLSIFVDGATLHLLSSLKDFFLFLCVPPKHDHKKEKVTKSVIFFIYVSDASCGADDADGTVFKRLSLAPRWFSIILKFNLEGFKWI